MVRIAGYEIPDNRSAPTTLQAQASKVQRDFAQALLPIRANTSLSSEGKRQEIARLFAPVVEEVARIQRRERDSYDDALATTEAALFGTTPGGTAVDVVANRDAFDRAESLPQGKDGLRQGQKLLERAEKTHDQSLVRALLVTALQRGWSTLVEDFTQRNTDIGPALDKYVALRAYDPDASLQAYYTYKITAPSEVGTTNPDRLRQIAAGESGQATRTPTTHSGPEISDSTRREYERMQASARRNRY